MFLVFKTEAVIITQSPTIMCIIVYNYAICQLLCTVYTDDPLLFFLAMTRCHDVLTFPTIVLLHQRLHYK